MYVYMYIYICMYIRHPEEELLKSARYWHIYIYVHRVVCSSVKTFTRIYIYFYSLVDLQIYIHRVGVQQRYDIPKESCYMYIYTYTNTCICIYTGFVCSSATTFPEQLHNIYVCTQLYIYIFIFVCMSIHICIHIHRVRVQQRYDIPKRSCSNQHGGILIRGCLSCPPQVTCLCLCLCLCLCVCVCVMGILIRGCLSCPPQVTCVCLCVCLCLCLCLCLYLCLSVCVWVCVWVYVWVRVCHCNTRSWLNTLQHTATHCNTLQHAFRDRGDHFDLL